MDQKDHIIQAMQEMVQDLTAKLINLRVASGIKLEKLEEELESLKNPPKKPDLKSVPHE